MHVKIEVRHVWGCTECMGGCYLHTQDDPGHCGFGICMVAHDG